MHDLSLLRDLDVEQLVALQLRGEASYDAVAAELERRGTPTVKPKRLAGPALVALTLSLDEPGTVPTEFCLLHAGLNTFHHAGDSLITGTILFDNEAAAETMKRYEARGIDLMADYEHQSLAHPPVIAPASAKRWVPEVREGDLYATAIDWTAKARQMLTDGEYRYFSIACLTDDTTNRCIELVNFALTNNPAANSIAPLVAARMLKATPRPAQLPPVSSLEQQLLKLTGAKTPAEGLKQLAIAKKRVRELEFDALLAEGRRAKKLTPAVQRSEWLKALRLREDGIETLRAFIANSVPAPIFADGPKEAPPYDGAPGITDMELKIAKDLVGHDPAKLEAHLEKLKLFKAERLNRRGR
jgi:phage I-like protein